MTIEPFSLSPGDTYVLQASVGMLCTQQDLVHGRMRVFIIFRFFLEITATSDLQGSCSRAS